MSARAWNWERQLHGIVPPLISPLDDAGAMAAPVDHVIGGGCSGLFMLGGCGEGAWLTAAQRGGVVRAAAGDFGAFQKLLAIERERPHFRVLQGHEALASASHLQGGDGMVPAFEAACAMPGLGNSRPPPPLVFAAPAAREAIAAFLDEAGLGTPAGVTRAR